MGCACVCRVLGVVGCVTFEEGFVTHICYTCFTQRVAAALAVISNCVLCPAPEIVIRNGQSGIRGWYHCAMSKLFKQACELCLCHEASLRPPVGRVDMDLACNNSLGVLLHVLGFGAADLACSNSLFLSSLWFTVHGPSVGHRQ